MKLTLKTLAVALAAITLSPAALADNAVDGTVHIHGTILQNACTVKTSSIDVPLQDEYASLFTAVGQTAGDKDFTIDLEHCDASVYEHVQARFEGTLDGTDNTILKNTEGDAANLGVQITDRSAGSADAAMAFNDLTAWSTQLTLPPESDSEFSLPFTARYIATAVPVEAGSVDATATFYLQYN
ncbi:fimbrial protein StiA [Salmonella enterica subsp. enterica serovar Stanleyville]|uniref:fimbrial protein n=1 Tax=Salmonella enterica TaxID=28901 RepID=UPI0003BDB437|nr:fimbrial protein [Salmonella enterica]EAA5957944.1 fimbrial protein StiA [Salmonella enterica subsp. enterica serovar Stanleyville]EBF8299041.1 fimbrial protein StiA [Salmonella enterica subsp. enterica serovar Mbandaka]EBS1068302.1 fimbrial protein StiA [Salmonella enterica subsp. enterica serovar Wangata]APV89952.1 fimbrial protein StiA [Salmonella enterica subsp. enterica serovar Mbandaka str. ATCC 51958]EAA6845720.1 fimbrial protein StiA [Salmonella enterica subsp. enterica serovar Stan